MRTLARLTIHFSLLLVSIGAIFHRSSVTGIRQRLVDNENMSVFNYLLEKLRSSDKDLRFMALNDLRIEMSGLRVNISPQHEDKLTAAVLELVRRFFSGVVSSSLRRCVISISDLLPTVRLLRPYGAFRGLHLVTES